MRFTNKYNVVRNFVHTFWWHISHVSFNCLTIVEFGLGSFIDTFLEIVNTIPYQRLDGTYPIWQGLDFWFLVLVSLFIHDLASIIVLKLSFQLRRCDSPNFGPWETEEFILNDIQMSSDDMARRTVIKKRSTVTCQRGF